MCEKGREREREREGGGEKECIYEKQKEGEKMRDIPLLLASACNLC